MWQGLNVEVQRNEGRENEGATCCQISDVRRYGSFICFSKEIKQQKKEQIIFVSPRVCCEYIARRVVGSSFFFQLQSHIFLSKNRFYCTPRNFILSKHAHYCIAMKLVYSYDQNYENPAFNTIAQGDREHLEDFSFSL